jgi:hypothetical protein
MNPGERERMNQLVEKIQVEKNHKVFIKLVEELNALLGRKEERLDAAERQNS